MVLVLINVFGDFVRIEKMTMFDNLGDINVKWAKVIYTIHWPIMVHCMVVDGGGLNGVDKTG